MQETKNNLPIIVAELINRMSPEEKEKLISNLDSETIYSLQEIKQQISNRDEFSEPEIYVRVTSEYISFEIPRAKIIDFIKRLTDFLNQKEVIIRYNENGTAHEEHVSASHLLKNLQEIREVLINDTVTFEFGSDTLYSIGAGCMLFETNLQNKEKGRIALEYLKRGGYYVKIKSDRFSISVRNGKIKIKEE